MAGMKKRMTTQNRQKSNAKKHPWFNHYYCLHVNKVMKPTLMKQGDLEINRMYVYSDVILGQFSSSNSTYMTLT